MDETRNTRAYAQSVFECSDQPCNPEDPDLHAPCSQTCRNLLKDVVRALEVVAWGRRRWNIKNGFKAEKHDGFGLEHTFCNDDTAGRNYRILMQIAYVLWQVFAHGMLRRVGERCRKMAQSGWARFLASALRLVGLRLFPAAAVGVMRMPRYRLAG